MLLPDKPRPAYVVPRMLGEVKWADFLADKQEPYRPMNIGDLIGLLSNMDPEAT